MALLTPAIEVEDVLDAILALLEANKTTLNTDLNGSTFTSNDQIIDGTPGVDPLPPALYPAIMVDIEEDEETFTQLGAAGRKRVSLIFYIYGITEVITAGTAGQSTSTREMINLAKNIKSILRQNINLSDTAQVLYSGPTRSEYGALEFEDGTFVKISKTEYQVNMEVK